MVTQIQSETDRIFSHLGPFFALLPPPPSLTTQKIKNFQKLKKMHGDTIILHRCTINENHMMYGSWDVEHDRENFFSFWTIFCLLTPPTNPENENFEKMNKMHGRYHYFTQVYHKSQSYDKWFLRYEAWQTKFFVILGHFCSFALLQLKKSAQKIKV